MEKKITKTISNFEIEYNNFSTHQLRKEFHRIDQSDQPISPQQLNTLLNVMNSKGIEIPQAAHSHSEYIKNKEGYIENNNNLDYKTVLGVFIFLSLILMFFK